MKLSSNFYLLIKTLLPFHKRQPKRLAFLNSLLPIDSLLNSFHTWANYTLMMISVNSQVKVLEGYLRSKYNNKNIIIKLYEDGLLPIGLLDEGDNNLLYVGESDFIDVALLGETVNEFDDIDFWVIIPQSLSYDEVLSEIEKYKLIDKTYKIMRV